MRIWVGKEMEGKYEGKQTMFIETPYLDAINIITVIPFIKNHKFNGLEALYLGAGRVDVKVIAIEQLKGLLYTCSMYNIVVTLETTNLNVWGNNKELLELLAMYDVQIVIRHQLKHDIPLALLNNIVTKLDDYNNCYFSPFKCNSVTNLSTLEDNMYVGVDRLIFNEEDF